MQAASLLAEKPHPTDAEIDTAMERQHLPLRYVYTHPRCNQTGGERWRDAVTVRSAAADTIINESRRAFLFGVGVGSLVLALGPTFAEEQEAKKYGGDAIANGTRDDPRVFVAIAEDGTVTIVCHRSEMGQGVRTSVAMVVADELEADWSRVKVVQAPGDEARFGSQNTIASRSLRHGFAPLRRAGAAARMMLEAAAAASWGVPLSEVKAQNHQVVHAATARRLDYGALAKKAAEQSVPPAARAQTQAGCGIPLYR